MNLFKKRMALKGLSSYERNMYFKKREFENWFNHALNRYKVSIDGVEQYAVFQDHNQNNNDNLSDDKFMITKNNSNVDVGSYVEWDSQTWLTFGYEFKTIQTHKQCRVKETNETFKWINKNGDICNEGKGYRGHVKNQTLYTLGVNTGGNHLWLANAQMMMFLPNNEEVDQLSLGDRLFIGKNVYQIMFNDDVSRIGLSNFLLEQDMLNANVDNIELRIADYYTKIGKEDNKEEEVDEGQKMVNIEGVEKAKVGSTQIYTANIINDEKETDEGIYKWSVIDADNAVDVINQNPNSITIKVKSDFGKVGSKISIVGMIEDGTVGSKSVNIVSPY